MIEVTITGIHGGFTTVHAHRIDHVWRMLWQDIVIDDKLRSYPPNLRDEWSKLKDEDCHLYEAGPPYWFKDMDGNVVTNANLEQLAQLAIQQPQLFKNAKAQVPDTKA